MNRRETPPGAPHPPIRSGLAEDSILAPGRSDPPVKPTSEVAHQPGQQPAAADDPWWCDCPDRKGPHVHMCNWDGDSRYSMIITALVDLDTGCEIPGTRK